MSIAEFAAGGAPKRDRPKGIRPVLVSDRNRFSSEVASMVRGRDWDRQGNDLKAGHLVCLYAWCHGEIYRVQPSELDDGKEFALASIHVRGFADKEFRGDLVEAVRFVQWTWKREEGREKWRLQNGKSGQRIGWRLQFSSSLVTDYRIDLARRAKNGG